MHSTESLWPASETATFPVTLLTSLALPSSEPEATSASVAWQSRQVSGAEWKPKPEVEVAHSPLRGFQTRRLQSSDPVTTALPSGVKAPQLSAPLWPANTCMQAPSSAFHIHAVKSSLPASSTCPRGCQHSHSMPPPGPSRARARAPVATSL